MEFMKIKIFPEFGDAYYVLIPESVEDIDAWIGKNLDNVDFWEDENEED